MLISPSFVLVKEIISHVPRSNFSEDDLNQAAKLILQVEGIIQPLILRPIGLDAYEVVDGHFEYYAAVRAKEIDSRRGERIGAFIIEGKNKEVLQQQVHIFRNREDTTTIEKNETRATIGVIDEDRIQETIQKDQTEKILKQLIDQLDTSLTKKIETVNQKIEQAYLRNVSVSQSNLEELSQENLLNQIEKLIENKLLSSMQAIQNSLNQQLEEIRVEIGKIDSITTKEPITKKLDKTQQEKFKELDEMYNKPELLAIVKKRGIKKYSKMNKSQLIDAIIASDTK